MVKDVRTCHKENNPGDVFDGAIESFISDGIRWRKQSAS
jgi:peptide chain release factor 2